MSKLDFKDLNNLNLLENALVQIRAISKESNRLPDNEKLILINQLAELSHNIPNIISQNGKLNFLDDQANQLEDFLMELPDKMKDISKKNNVNDEIMDENIKSESTSNLTYYLYMAALALVVFLLLAKVFGIKI